MKSSISWIPSISSSWLLNCEDCIIDDNEEQLDEADVDDDGEELMLQAMFEEYSVPDVDELKQLSSCLTNKLVVE